MNTKANNFKKAEEVLKKFKGYETPEEVREDEAHLTHLIFMRSVANTQTMEFEHTAQLVKLNEESLEATKNQFKTLGANEIVTLHDGKEYQKKKRETDAKEAEEAKEAKKAEEAKKEEEAKAKDNRIAELEAQLAKKESKPKAEEVKGEEAKADEAKKQSGKG